MVGQSQVGRSQVGMSGQSQSGHGRQSQVGIGSQSQVAPLPGSSSQPGLAIRQQRHWDSRRRSWGRKNRAEPCGLGFWRLDLAWRRSRLSAPGRYANPKSRLHRSARFVFDSERAARRPRRASHRSSRDRQDAVDVQPAGGEWAPDRRAQARWLCRKVVSLDQSEGLPNHSETLKPLASSTVSQATPPPAPVCPNPQRRRVVAKGKQKVGAVATAPAGTATGTTQAATQVTTASPFRLLSLLSLPRMNLVMVAFRWWTSGLAGGRALPGLSFCGSSVSVPALAQNNVSSEDACTKDDNCREHYAKAVQL